MKRYIFLALTLAISVSVFAQNKMLSSKQLMTGTLYPRPTIRGLQFVGSTNQTAYVQDTVVYYGQPGKVKPILTLSQLNKAMSAASMDNLTYVPSIEFVNAKEVRFSTAGKILQYNLTKKTLACMANYPTDEDACNHDVEQSGFKTAYTMGNNLFVFNAGKSIAITNESDQDIVYGQSVHRNEFGINKGTFWSPQGNLLAFYRMDQSMVTDYPMVNTTARIAREQPFKYPMAGMKSHEVTVGIYNVAKDSVLYLDSRRDESIDERENYLTNLSWSPLEDYLYIAKINREQNHMWLERYNVTDGEFDTILFEEANSRYIEPCDPMIFVPSHPDQFLWFSLRDGYKHLYLYNTDGQLLKQVTKGSYEVEGFIGFDAKVENIFIYANKESATGRAAYKVNLATGQMTLLTPAKGTHTVIINPAGTTMIDIYNSVENPGTAKVIDIVKGKELTTLYQLSNPLADYAMPGIEMGSIKAADGKTDLYYRLITPPHMEPGKKYPTLVYVYGGPHSQLVTDTWLGGGNLYFTFLAQQGYVVFTVDNRGTDNRGFEFESCTHRQLGTIEMADQMEGVKFLQSLPFVDKDRMGVEGWSFGGFMTISLKLAHPEIFKVGCAGGPVIDWKWYEIMYGERYMDTPQENPEGYAKNCLTSKAKDLQGRLLVIHGAEDNTVVWQHSIEFIDACIKAGKQVDYFVYPHHEHNVRGYDRLHLYEKMFDYYETYLK
ncbi:MAG: S9 family peptidase [Bacteroidales bacterium]|nr:S9 family peptidase [Bacteroidales bacterium]